MVTQMPYHWLRSGSLRRSLMVTFLPLLATMLGLPPVIAAATPVTLTLYSAQHSQVVRILTAAFTAETGIPVRVHSGEAPEIANQILEEGANSPADMVFVENSPEIVLLDEHHLLAPVDAATLAAVPRSDSASDGNWLGVLARENVLAWNPKLIAQNSLPHHLLALAEPAWKGKVAIAPGDADFLPLVGAVIHAEGSAKALAWLEGLKHNARIYQDDEGVVAAVDRGSVATGIINNYYWARLRTELGADHTTSRIAQFASGDLGCLINVSSAAVLASSKHRAEAERFLAFLVSQKAQMMLAASSVDYEYPLRPGVAANPLLAPMSSLHPPVITPAELGADRTAARLLQRAGLL